MLPKNSQAEHVKIQNRSSYLGYFQKCISRYNSKTLLQIKTFCFHDMKLSTANRLPMLTWQGNHNKRKQMFQTSPFLCSIVLCLKFCLGWAKLTSAHSKTVIKNPPKNSESAKTWVVSLSKIFIRTTFFLVGTKF